MAEKPTNRERLREITEGIEQNIKELFEIFRCPACLRLSEISDFACNQKFNFIRNILQKYWECKEKYGIISDKKVDMGRGLPMSTQPIGKKISDKIIPYFRPVNFSVYPHRSQCNVPIA